jgi:hypothetical protein
MNEQLLSGIIGLSSAILGATGISVSVYIASRKQRKNEQLKILFDARKEAYLEFIRIVAASKDLDREKRTRLIESKLKICLLGGDTVISALYIHFKEIDTKRKLLGELDFDFEKVLLAMREDLFTKPNSVDPKKLNSLFFGFEDKITNKP